MCGGSRGDGRRRLAAIVFWFGLEALDWWTRKRMTRESRWEIRLTKLASHRIARCECAWCLHRR